jgi:hypothetical protein
MAKRNTIYCKRFVKIIQIILFFWDETLHREVIGPRLSETKFCPLSNVEKSKNRKEIQSCVTINYDLIFKTIHMSVLLWYLITILELDFQNNLVPLTIMHLKNTVPTSLGIGLGALCTILSNNMHICSNSWYARGGQLADLRETQFRRQNRQETEWLRIDWSKGSYRLGALDGKRKQSRLPTRSVIVFICLLHDGQSPRKEDCICILYTIVNTL